MEISFSNFSIRMYECLHCVLRVSFASSLLIIVVFSCLVGEGGVGGGGHFAHAIVFHFAFNSISMQLFDAVL